MASAPKAEEKPRRRKEFVLKEREILNDNFSNGQNSASLKKRLTRPLRILERGF